MKNVRYTRVTECSSTRRFPAVKSRIWASISPSSAMRKVTMYFSAWARVTSLVGRNRSHRMVQILAGSSSFSTYVINRPEIVGSRIALAFAALASHASSSVLYRPLSCSLAVASSSLGLASFSVTSRTLGSGARRGLASTRNDNYFRSNARFGWRMVSHCRRWTWCNDLIKDDGKVLCRRWYRNVDFPERGDHDREAMPGNGWGWVTVGCTGVS